MVASANGMLFWGLCLYAIVCTMILLLGGNQIYKLYKGIQEWTSRVAQSVSYTPKGGPSSAPTQLACEQLPKFANVTIDASVKDLSSFMLQLSHRLGLSAQKQAGGFSPSDPIYSGWKVIETKELPFFAAVGEHMISSEGAFFGSHTLIVFRGTMTVQELSTNDIGLDYLKDHTQSVNIAYLLNHNIPMPYPPQQEIQFGMDVASCNAGFVQTFESLKPQLVAHMSKLSSTAKVIMGGHSLGAAVALIGALDFKVQNRHFNVSVINAATPKPGDVRLYNLLTSHIDKIICFANECDSIPWSPASVIPNLVTLSGNFTYVQPPGLMVFMQPCKDIVTAHSIETYLAGIASL